MRQFKLIKDPDGNVLKSLLKRWIDYFEELMNEENEQERSVEDMEKVE